MSELLLYLLCIGGALAGYFFLTLPLSLIVIGFCALFAAWSLFAPDNSAKIGRFDEKIVFKPLSPDTQREIAHLTLSEELARFRERGFDLMVSGEAFEFLVRCGIHKTLGARPMKKTVQKFIGDAIRDALKSGATPSGSLLFHFSMTD